MAAVVETAETKRELTTKEAAELAGVTDGYIRRMMIRGTLRGRKVGKVAWLVRRDSLQDWMETRGR